MSKTEVHQGGCLCGAIRYRATGAPLRVGLCHCGQCRRQTGSALPSFVTWPRKAVEITKGKPAGIRLSDYATREFCRDCGSPLFWRADKGEDITVPLGSLDDAEAMPKPSYELWTERRLHWVPELPGIKSYRQEPARG